MNSKNNLMTGALLFAGTAAAAMPLYHAIVRRLVRENFAQLSGGNYEHILRQMAPQFDHFFSGEHPLGGKRHKIATMRRWFERLYRLNRKLNFEIQQIAVSGMPWNTKVVVEWIDRATLATGESYANQGVHFVQMRWGKVVSLHAYLDTKLWSEVCEKMAANGIAEAAASPLNDEAKTIEPKS